MRYNYVAIEGTMGAGKTTLSTMISNDLNGKLILEEFEPDKNPFLAKFYENPDKYAFQVEMTFLALRFQQLKDKLGNLDLFHDFIISDYYVAKSLCSRFRRKRKTRLSCLGYFLHQVEREVIDTK